MTDEYGNGIFQYCLEPGCDWTETWSGGSAADDPSLVHLFTNPDHTVRGGVNDEHKRNYERQKNGKDVTAEKIEL